RTEPRREPQGNGCDVSALERVGTAWRTTSRPSALLREALIRFLHRLLAIGALEAANSKVTSRHLLEMLDERVVHGSAAQRADERDGLSGELLRDHDSETGCDLADEAHENRAAFLDDAALDDESRGLRYAFCQHAAHGKISALGSIGRTGPSAQREYLHARERRFRIGQIFAFAARNFRNRPQHDDGRERQLDGERRQTEGAASGAGGGSQGLVQALRSRARRLVHAPQRDLERHLECLRGGGGDRLRGGSGERVSDKLDRLARPVPEPPG